MRNAIFASAIALLAAFVLMVAGPAMAQPKISGAAAASFGQVSVDTGGTGDTETGDSFFTTIEANFIATGGNGTMDYYFRLRGRGTEGNTVPHDFEGGTFADNQLQTVRVRVGWNVTDQFRIEMGKMPGIGGTGAADINNVRTPGGIGAPVNKFGMWDSGAINLAFKATPQIRVGLAISSDCQVGCTAGADARPAAAGGGNYEGNFQTLMPYANLNFGDIGISLRLPQSSGDAIVSGKSETVESDAVGFEAKYSMDQIYVALEYYDSTKGCVGSGCFEETQTDTTLALKAYGLGLQIGSSDIDVNKTTTETEDFMAVWYEIPMGDGGKVFPEIGQLTLNDGTTGAKDSTVDYIRLGMKVGF